MSSLLARTSVTALAIGLSGCITLNLLPGPRQPLVETVVQGQRGPKIVLIDVEGPIGERPRESSFGLREPQSMVERIREQLDVARNDAEVRALLLRINSPGGTATGSEVLFREISRFKRERGAPVVSQLMGVATSGAYYVAMASDRVVAYPTTITGSIGVIFWGVNFSGLMGKLGIENQTITTGSYKDAGSPLRPMARKERRYLERVLDDLHVRFREVVAAGRSELSAEDVAALADGRIFSAPQALDAGLIDRIGDLDDAVAEAEKLAGIEESRVVLYHRPPQWKPNIYSQPPSAPGRPAVLPGTDAASGLLLSVVACGAVIVEPADFVRQMTPAMRQAAAIARALEGRVSNRPKHDEATAVKAALTIADTAAQEALLVALLECCPDVRLEAEEDTPTVAHFPRDGDPLVVIDPIDGTLHSYLGGEGAYAVMMGLAERGRYRAALVGLPREGLLFDAVAGAGARVAGPASPVRPAKAEAKGDRILVSHECPDGVRAHLREAGYEVGTASGGAIAVAPLIDGVRAGVRIATKNDVGVSIRGRIGAMIATEAGALVRCETGDPFPPTLDAPARALLVAACPDDLSILRESIAGLNFSTV